MEVKTASLVFFSTAIDYESHLFVCLKGSTDGEEKRVAEEGDGKKKEKGYGEE
jgi:hypothetical protein